VVKQKRRNEGPGGPNPGREKRRVKKEISSDTRVEYRKTTAMRKLRPKLERATSVGEKR